MLTASDSVDLARDDLHERSFHLHLARRALIGLRELAVVTVTKLCGL